MSLKAARILKSAQVIAYFAKKGSVGNARRIVDGQLNPDAELVRLDYPFTTELPETDPLLSRRTRRPFTTRAPQRSPPSSTVARTWR